MTNVASVLKAEIARVARKEIRAEIEGLKKASAQQRASIAQLRREVAALEKSLKLAQRLAQAGGTTAVSSASDESSDETPRRFSPTRLAAHRKRLELSAADYGKLVGVSGQTVYNWEQGKARPARKMVQMLGFVKLQTPTAILARVAELSAVPDASGTPEASGGP